MQEQCKVDSITERLAAWQVSYTDKVVEPAASNGAAAPEEEAVIDTEFAEPAASES